VETSEDSRAGGHEGKGGNKRGLEGRRARGQGWTQRYNEGQGQVQGQGREWYRVSSPFLRPTGQPINGSTLHPPTPRALRARVPDPVAGCAPRPSHEVMHAIASRGEARPRVSASPPPCPNCLSASPVSSLPTGQLINWSTISCLLPLTLTLPLTLSVSFPPPVLRSSCPRVLACLRLPCPLAHLPAGQLTSRLPSGQPINRSTLHPPTANRQPLPPSPTCLSYPHPYPFP